MKCDPGMVDQYSIFQSKLSSVYCYSISLVQFEVTRYQLFNVTRYLLMEVRRSHAVHGTLVGVGGND